MEQKVSFIATYFGNRFKDTKKLEPILMNVFRLLLITDAIAELEKAMKI